MVLLVIGVLCVVAGVVLLITNTTALGIVALVVGVALLLAWLFRRRGRRTSNGDAAVLGSINS